MNRYIPIEAGRSPEFARTIVSKPGFATKEGIAGRALCPAGLRVISAR
jgi:hypothetical protein